MNSNSISDSLKYSGSGFLYGLTIKTLIYPLEVIKLRQQDPLCHQRCDQIARDLFHKGRWQIFYTGLSAKLVESGQKHLWRWPLIMQLPPLLKDYGCSEMQQQAGTGLVIGTVDAFFSTPLDRLKLAAIYQLQKTISWRGFPTFYAKCTVEWTTFLVAQNYFSKLQQSEKKPLTLQQSLIVALQTTVCVSVARAPFDVANTLHQTEKFFHLRNKTTSELFRKMYRGFPLGFSSLLFYNFCTTIFFDNLKKLFK